MLAGLGSSMMLGPSRWTPRSLFQSGIDGCWYDPSDPNSLWTDSIGGTNATVGSAVQVMEDKSGKGRHMTQATSANRPILRQTAGGLFYLEFDGTNDAMGVAGSTANWGTVSDGVVIAGYREVTRQASNLFALSDINTASQRWSAHAPWSDGNVYFDAGGATSPNRVSAAWSHAAGTDVVATFKCSTTDSEQSVRVNGSSVASDATGHSVVTGSGTGKDFYIGAADDAAAVTNHMAMRLYNFIFVKDALTTTERDNAEDFVAARSGVTLP